MSKLGAKAKRAKASSAASSTPDTHRFCLCKRCRLPVEMPPPAACPKCGVSGDPWVPLQGTDGLTLQDLREYGESVESKANLKAVLRKHWITTLMFYVEKLNEDTAEISLEQIGFFWIRLHGALTELSDDLAAGAFAGVSDEDVKRLDPTILGYVRAARSAMAAVERMRNALSRDLHIYADWRRQTECHLQQSAYAVQVKGPMGGQRRLKHSSEVKALGTSELVMVKERDAARRRVLTEHQNDDEVVARSVAKLILEPARQLAAAADAFP